MNAFLHGYRATLMIGLICALTACGGGGSDSSAAGSGGDDGGGGSTASQPNSAQKGPFQPGATVTVAALDDDGAETGQTANVDVGENGEFTLPEVGWTGPSMISVTGTFFDETSGTFTGQARTLKAFAVLPEEADANVNLYTHLIAGGMVHYMAQTNESVDTIREVVRDALRDTTGLQGNPIDLNLLHAAENPQESDGANLLLFSAAFLSAGLDQADLDAMVEDFRGNGKFDGVAETQWRAMQQAANDNPDLLAEAAGALRDQYSSQPPAGDGSGMAWLPGPCERALLNEPRAVCVGTPFDGEDTNDSDEDVVFVPPVTGRYTVALFGDAGVSDDNTNTCSWTIRQGASQQGDSSHTDGFCGVEDMTNATLEGGEEYVIRPKVGRDDAGAPAYFTLSVYRNADGRSSDPVTIDDFPFDGRVGTLIGGSDTSYYRFTAGSDGTRTLTLSDYPCANDSHIRVELFAPPADAGSKFSSTHRVASSADEQACAQNLQHGFEAGRDYYLRVINKTAFMKTFRPAPGSTDFTIEQTD